MGEILLDWEGHDKAMSNKLWEFLKEEYLVDFSVTCHGQQMKVHKFVMAFLFPMLKESLWSTDPLILGPEESARNHKVSTAMLATSQCLSLDNIAEHADDLDYLIQFAYTGKATVPEEHADCLMHIADSMEIESLKESIGQWYSKRKLNDNCSPPSRLRPRTQLKKFISESEDIIISDGDDDDDDNDSDFLSIVNDDITKEITKIDSDKKANNDTSSKQRTTKSRVSKTKKKKNQNLKCEYCDYVAKFPSKLQYHLQTRAKKDPNHAQHVTNCATKSFGCKYCEYVTDRNKILIQHTMEKHHVDSEGNPIEKDMKCPDCNFVCYTKHQLQSHVLAKHKFLNKFKCKDCNFSAPYISDLQRHDRVMHQNIRNHMCEECGYRFPTSAKLRDHVLVRHKGLKLFKCEVCGKEYSDSLSFKIHMQSHEGKVEYKFVCHICGHNLRRKYELRDHMRKKHGMELDGHLVTDNPGPCLGSEDTGKEIS